MDITARITEAEQKFEQKKAERDNHLKQAEECLVELNKLQGEYRVLNDLLSVEDHQTEGVEPEVKVEGE